MAIDLLTISAMNADTERLFWQAKLTMTDNRNSLLVGKVEMLQCLKSWAKDPYISGMCEVSFLNWPGNIATDGYVFRNFQTMLLVLTQILRIDLERVLWR